MGFLLFIVAFVLAVFLGIVSLPVSFFIITVQTLKKAKAKSKFGWKFLFYWIDRMWVDLNKVFFAAAISIDQFGNVFLQHLFNWALIQDMYIGITKDELFGHLKNEHKFGNEDETISSVLGKNERQGTLRPLGKALVWVLDKLDPNHSIKSIEEDE